MDPSEVKNFIRVGSIQEIESLPPDTQHVFVYCLDDDKAMAASRLRNLKTLFTDGSNSITDVGLQARGAIRSLEALDLEWSDKITDNGLLHLSGLVQLKFLDLGFCRETNRRRGTAS